MANVNPFGMLRIVFDPEAEPLSNTWLFLDVITQLFVAAAYKLEYGMGKSEIYNIMGH